jgi:hypothetical protein
LLRTLEQFCKWRWVAKAPILKGSAASRQIIAMTGDAARTSTLKPSAALMAKPSIRTEVPLQGFAGLRAMAGWISMIYTPMVELPGLFAAPRTIGKSDIRSWCNGYDGRPTKAHNQWAFWTWPIGGIKPKPAPPRKTHRSRVARAGRG